MLNFTNMIIAATLAFTSFGFQKSATAPSKLSVNEDGDQLTITSTAFKSGQMIPNKYTCKGSNVNPSLHIDGIPEGTKSVTVMMVDPDAMVEGGFTHWLAWNFDPTMLEIPENYKGGVQGMNMNKRVGYYGPCPPQGTHHYHYKVYALSERLKIPASSDRKKVEAAMEGKILAQGELVGIYTIKK
jgi:Raf kinase inhibitor-like YbhB/YbcL family protein